MLRIRVKKLMRDLTRIEVFTSIDLSILSLACG